MNWYQGLWDYLCRIYREMGGNCADLGIGPPEWINSVVAAYAAHGAPSFETEEKRLAFLKLLRDLESYLGLPGNTLSPSDNEKLLNLITALQQAERPS